MYVSTEYIMHTKMMVFALSLSLTSKIKVRLRYKNTKQELDESRLSSET